MLQQSVKMLHDPVQASEEGENANFSYGVCAMQGWRTEMVSFTEHLPAVLCVSTSPAAHFSKCMHTWIA